MEPAEGELVNAAEPTLYPGYWASVSPDKPAVIMATSGEVMTYGALDRAANRLSHWFRSIGLQPGDHVAFSMENRIEFLPIIATRSIPMVFASRSLLFPSNEPG